MKARLVLAELARREAIEVTDEEVEADLQRMGGQTESEETRKAILDAFGTEQGRAIIRQDLQTSKTLERLRAIATGLMGAATAAVVESTAAKESTADTESVSEIAAEVAAEAADTAAEAAAEE